MPIYWGSDQVSTVLTGQPAIPIDMIYPVGSIYMSINNTNPSLLFGGTWEQISDRFLLGAGTTYTNGNTGGSATVTLTTEQMPAHTHTGASHNHGLNSHTHSIPALSGTAASNGAHTHGDPSGRKFMFTNGDVAVNSTGRNGVSTGGDWYYVYGATSSTGIWEGSATSSSGSHTHSVSTNSSTSGQASGNTTAAGTDATSSTGGGAAHDNMPPYLVVYIWKRTA